MRRYKNTLKVFILNKNSTRKHTVFIVLKDTPESPKSECCCYYLPKFLQATSNMITIILNKAQLKKCLQEYKFNISNYFNNLSKSLCMTLKTVF